MPVDEQVTFDTNAYNEALCRKNKSQILPKAEKFFYHFSSPYLDYEYMTQEEYLETSGLIKYRPKNLDINPISNTTAVYNITKGIKERYPGIDLTSYGNPSPYIMIDGELYNKTDVQNYKEYFDKETLYKIITETVEPVRGNKNDYIVKEIYKDYPDIDLTDPGNPSQYISIEGKLYSKEELSGLDISQTTDFDGNEVYIVSGIVDPTNKSTVKFASNGYKNGTFMDIMSLIVEQNCDKLSTELGVYGITGNYVKITDLTDEMVKKYLGEDYKYENGKIYDKNGNVYESERNILTYNEFSINLPYQNSYSEAEAIVNGTTKVTSDTFGFGMSVRIDSDQYKETKGMNNMLYLGDGIEQDGKWYITDLLGNKVEMPSYYTGEGYYIVLDNGQIVKANPEADGSYNYGKVSDYVQNANEYRDYLTDQSLEDTYKNSEFNVITSGDNHFIYINGIEVEISNDEYKKLLDKDGNLDQEKFNKYVKEHNSEAANSLEKGITVENKNKHYKKQVKAISYDDEVQYLAIVNDLRTKIKPKGIEIDTAITNLKNAAPEYNYKCPNTGDEVKNIELACEELAAKVEQGVRILRQTDADLKIWFDQLINSVFDNFELKSSDAKELTLIDDIKEDDISTSKTVQEYYEQYATELEKFAREIAETYNNGIDISDMPDEIKEKFQQYGYNNSRVNYDDFVKVMELDYMQNNNGKKGQFNLEKYMTENYKESIGTLENYKKLEEYIENSDVYLTTWNQLDKASKIAKGLTITTTNEYEEYLKNTRQNYNDIIKTLKISDENIELYSLEEVAGIMYQADKDNKSLSKIIKDYANDYTITCYNERVGYKEAVEYWTNNYDEKTGKLKEGALLLGEFVDGLCEYGTSAVDFFKALSGDYTDSAKDYRNAYLYDWFACDYTEEEVEKKYKKGEISETEKNIRSQALKSNGQLILQYNEFKTSSEGMKEMGKFGSKVIHGLIEAVGGAAGVAIVAGFKGIKKGNEAMRAAYNTHLYSNTETALLGAFTAVAYVGLTYATKALGKKTMASSKSGLQITADGSFKSKIADTKFKKFQEEVSELTRQFKAGKMPVEEFNQKIMDIGSRNLDFSYDVETEIFSRKENIFGIDNIFNGVYKVGSNYLIGSNSVIEKGYLTDAFTAVLLSNNNNNPYAAKAKPCKSTIFSGKEFDISSFFSDFQSGSGYDAKGIFKMLFGIK